MGNDHGLSGLFDEDGSVRVKKPASKKSDAPKNDDLPPVLDDADKSPLHLLADKIGFDPSEGSAAPAPPPPPEKAPPAPEPEPEAFAPELAPPPPPSRPAAPKPAAAEAPRYRPADDGGHDAFAAALGAEPVARQPAPVPEMSAAKPAESLPRRGAPAPAVGGSILCFLIPSDDDRARRRTLEAINVAAGTGSVRLRSLPRDPSLMDEALFDALATSDSEFVAFLSAGTEPADDWAIEVQKVFEEYPSAGAVTVRAANADPLSPWARVGFFMDEVERQNGLASGLDTMVFRASVLREIGEQLGVVIRNGRLASAVEGRGHRIVTASEARVSIATPGDRREVIRHVKEQARLAARQRAKGKNPFTRFILAAGILLGYPFRIMTVRAAAKKSIGSTQFREVASKAAMAILADRHTRARTMLFPGKDKA
ncbi:glycosyltransferase family protein [Parvularcula lutaonensis]|uniref:Glycosyltransferase family 2 protein n=1 Tax=Parvularcula lutaonensis TaxID=491923 RepID=A0ABV7M9H5_9PROT|nr:glycosyltransferase family 2 protein [Parvularcula lutaonensis]GGY43317.1 hypothetical protein GCM10007148_10050 [Parvularcula lutaonensis]